MQFTGAGMIGPTGRHVPSRVGMDSSHVIGHVTIPPQPMGETRAMDLPTRQPPATSDLAQVTTIPGDSQVPLF